MINAKVQYTGQMVQMKRYKKNVLNEMKLKETGNFTALPNQIWESDLKDSTIRILGFIASKSNLKYQLSRKTISKALNYDESTIKRAIKILKQKGFLEHKKITSDFYEYKVLNPYQKNNEKEGAENPPTRGQKIPLLEKENKSNSNHDIASFIDFKETIEGGAENPPHNKKKYIKEEIIIPDLQKNISDVPEKINNNNLGKFDLDEKLTELFTPDENNWSLFKRSDITRWKNLWSGDYKNLSEIVEAIPFFLEESKDEAPGRDAYNFQSSLGYIKNVLDRKWNFPKWFRTPEQKRQEKSKNVFLKNKESEKEIENKLHEIAIKEGAGLAGKAGFVSIIHELSESCINQVLSIISINQVKEYVREVLTDSKYQLVCKMDKNLKSLKSKDLNILLAEVENIFNISEKAGV